MDTKEQLALLQLIAEGNQAALAQLYALFKARVYNTALSYVQNISEAEELTQDVFVKIYRSAAFFEGKSSVSTWIYRITVNQALDKIRQRGRRKQLGGLFLLSGIKKDLSELPTFEHPGVLLEKKEHARILFQAIESLPEQQKTAFILCFIEELPRQEAADIMQISLKALESLLQRAKSNLRERLEDFAPPRRI